MAQILRKKITKQTKLTAYTRGETIINVYLHRVLNLLNISNVTGLPKTTRRQNPITSSSKRIAQYNEDQQTS